MDEPPSHFPLPHSDRSGCFLLLIDSRFLSLISQRPVGFRSDIRALLAHPVCKILKVFRHMCYLISTPATHSIYLFPLPLDRITGRPLRNLHVLDLEPISPKSIL